MPTEAFESRGEAGTRGKILSVRRLLLKSWALSRLCSSACPQTSPVIRCRGENQVVVVSIFVNPSQFNDPSVLERYPRPIHQDLALLQSLGVDEVIVPSVRELYPNGYRFRVEPHGSDLVLEGAHR